MKQGKWDIELGCMQQKKPLKGQWKPGSSSTKEWRVLLRPGESNQQDAGQLEEIT